MTMRSDYDLLIQKLDAFTRKYYKDRLIRGGLYSVGLLVLVFLAVTLGEYAGHFGTTARTLLFWGSSRQPPWSWCAFVVIPVRQALSGSVR
jgi:hypothetical protein